MYAEKFERDRSVDEAGWSNGPVSPYLLAGQTGSRIPVARSGKVNDEAQLFVSEIDTDRIRDIA